jgi:hypothetical protein
VLKGVIQSTEPAHAGSFILSLTITRKLLSMENSQHRRGGDKDRDHEQERRFVDMRVPLTWLLTASTTIMLTLGTTLWTIASQSTKLDTLVTTVVEMKKGLADRDIRLDILRDQLYAQQRITDNLKQRIEVVESMKR